MAYFKENIKLFVESFKVDKKILGITAAYDLVLMLVSYIILFLWSLYITSSFSRITGLDLSKFTEETLRQAASLKSFYCSAIISLIILAILLFIAWSFFKGLIWCSIADKHFNLKYFKKFLLLNLACIPLYLAVFAVFFLVLIITNYIFILLSSSSQNALLTLITMPLLFFIFFMPIIIYIMVPLSLVYYNFTKKNSISNSFKKMFGIAVKKIHLFYFPCFLITIVLVLISIATIPMNYVSESISYLVSLAIFFLYIAWARPYIISFSRSLEEKHHKI